MAAPGPVGSVMDAAERAQGMLEKDLSTAVIVLLGLLVVVLVRALVRVTNARVDDAKAVTKGLMDYVQENTASNISLTRAVETKLGARKPRVAADPPPALAPGPTLPPGEKP
jgi:hypothetical protein